MSDDFTTQMLTPSLRRVYTSRAFLIAISASGACRLPACLCAKPCWLRMNTSQSGQSFISVSGLRGHRAFGLLFCVCSGGVAHPRALFMGADASLQAVAIAGTVTLNHLVKLFPIDLAEIVVPALRIPLQIRIRNF